LFGLIFAYFGERFLRAAKPRDALLMGVALGCIGSIRYYSAVIFFLVFLGYLVLTRSRKDLLPFLGVLVGVLPFIAVLMLYNHAITGDALMTVTQWGYDDPETYPGLPADLSTVWETAVRLVTSGVELGDFTSPLLLAMYGVALIAKAMKRELRFYDFMFIAFVLGYMLVQSSGGNRYGPRYYYDAFPFLVLTVISGARQMINRRELGIAGNVAMHLLVLNVILSVCYLPFIALYVHRIIVERQDVFTLVESEAVRNAVVLLSTGTGVLREMSRYDLVRNGTTINGEAIFAHDWGRRNRELRALFPGRAFWVYQREPGAVHGTLVPLGP
jgi:hypothetical protein